MGLIAWVLVGNGLSGAAADPRSRSLHSKKLPGGSGRSLPDSALHFIDDTNRQRATRHHWPSCAPLFVFSAILFNALPVWQITCLLIREFSRLVHTCIYALFECQS